MSSRVLNSRFNRRDTRSTPPSSAPLPQAPVTAPAKRRAPGDAPPVGGAPEPAERLEAPLGVTPVECVRFGFVRLFGKLTVIEVSEEVWGSRRYYTAVFSEDPSVCIKALNAEEAVATLIRHLMRSPTIRRFHFGQPACPEA